MTSRRLFTCGVGHSVSAVQYAQQRVTGHVFGGTRTLRHALEPSHGTQRTWSLLLGFRSLPPNPCPGQRNPHQLTLNCNLVFAATCLFSPPVLPTHPLTQHFYLDKSNVRAVPRQQMCDQGRGALSGTSEAIYKTKGHRNLHKNITT